MTRNEELFCRAAEIYVLKKNKEYPEFYLHELSEAVGYKIEFDDLSDIVSDEMEVACNRDTAISYNKLSGFNSNYKVIRKNNPDNKYPIMYLNCVIRNITPSKLEFSCLLKYDRNTLYHPVKVLENVVIEEDELDTWVFK